MRSLVIVYMPLLILLSSRLHSQSGGVKGKIFSVHSPVASATVSLLEINKKTVADSAGNFSFSNLPDGSYKMLVSSIGYYNSEYSFIIKEEVTINIEINLERDNTMLGNVVVTGVSKATLIHENPVAISVVSSKQLTQTLESNLIDALSKKVNGLHVVKTGPNISKPFIRGLGYNRVLTLYDGLRQEGQQWGDEHGIEADGYHIAKAEVIKGPASLQFGSDAIAGVVSLFPYLPKPIGHKAEGAVTSEYQSNNNVIGNGLRMSYANRHLLFAASGSVRIAGNYRNAIDGKVYNTGFTEKNLSLLTGMSSQNGYSHFILTWYENLQGIPDGSRDSLSRRFTKQAAEGGKDDVKDRPVVSEKELHSYRLSPLHQHIQHYRVYTRHAYHMRKGDIDALVGFQQNIRREYNHPTQPRQAGMYVRLNTLNYNLRYTAQEWKHIELTTGINGMLQNNKSLDATDFPIPDYHLFDGGIYVYGKWKKDRWTISGGIRNDIRTVAWNDFYIKTKASNGFAYHATGNDTANGHLQFSSYRKAFQGISASLGFTYRLNDHLNIKANIGRGYRAPSITEMASNGLDPGAHIIYLGNKSFVPEFSLQQDIGVSLNSDNVSSDMSIFNNHIQHYIYLTLLTDESGNAITDAQGNRTFQYQQSAAQLYGLEAWVSFHPSSVKGFRFDNSISFVHGFNRKDEFRKKGNEGEYLPLIPPLKIVSCAEKKTELSSDIIASLTVTIESEYNARQNRFLGLSNTETFTPSYFLLNAGLTSEVKFAKEKTLQVVLQVNNVANTVYQSHLSRLKYFEYYAASGNQHSGIYNMGRNACIKLIAPF